MFLRKFTKNSAYEFSKLGSLNLYSEYRIYCESIHGHSGESSSKCPKKNQQDTDNKHSFSREHNNLHLIARFSLARKSFTTIANDQNHHGLLTLFDPFLPPNLRLQNEIKATGETEAAQPIQDMIKILVNSLISSSWKLEPLSQLGLHQHRWPAFIWLIKEILSVQQPLSNSHRVSPLNGWAQESMSLNELTSDRSFAEKISQQQSPEPLKESLDSILRTPQQITPGDGRLISLDSLGYLWICLGSIIIQAINMNPEAAAPVMANVYQVIALMHHHDVIPRTIYDYSAASDTSAIRRPPTLRLLHSRILTILSDAAWTANEAQILKEAEIVGARYTHKGYELPGAEYRPRIRSIDLETWLEYALWSCVESGRIIQASWIISRLVDSEHDGTPWTVVSWDTMRHSNKFGNVDIKSTRNKFVGAASTAEGYSEELPPIVMNTRTISKEVVEAVLDGLHSIVNNRGRDIEQMVPPLLKIMEDCKNLIETGKTLAKSKLWDRTLLRVSEGLNCDVSMASGFLSGVPNPCLDCNLDQRPTLCPSLHSQSSIMMGFMQLALQACIDTGLLRGSLQSFQKLLGIADSSWAEVIEGLTRKSPIELQYCGSVSLSEYQETENFRNKALTKISDRTLATFLDFLSHLKLYSVAHWLLASQDIDGPITSQKNYTSSILQPALLQFAAATSDVELLSKVAANLPTPLSRENTIALLYCQIAIRQWDRVNDILATAKVKGFVIPLTVISRVAQTIVIDEHIQMNNAMESSLVQAEHTMMDLIAGKYDQEPNHSTSPRFLRRQQVNQISRILASLPGRLSMSMAKLARLSGQSHTTTMVDSKAFDIILDGVVQAFGPSAGKNLWQKWCVPPGAKGVISYSRDGQEMVVRPTIQTLNIILVPLALGTKEVSYRDGLQKDSRFAIKNYKTGETPATIDYSQGREVRENSSASSQERHAILSWATLVLRDFGLHESTVAAELEIYLPKSVY